MNTEQTAQQLELAAKILRSGHPWEYNHDKDFWQKASGTSVLLAIAEGWPIRPILAIPPDNRPIHNPDNLTAEQVGVGYRLLCAEDGVPSGKVDTWMFGGWCSAYVVDKEHLYECDKTYRLPLSVPWPEPQPDPYAELKKAHAEGKVIQGCIRGHWIDCPHPTWKYPVNTYREKPDEKKTVPFDISDVPPCSVLSLDPPRWFDIYGVCKEGIYVLDDEPLVETLWKWNYLAEKVKINRSIPLTGKWNSDAWEPCQKQIDA
jgi:hypothetical protein